MTQNEKILRHLEDYGSITPMEAMEQYGIMRLGARIWELKRKGHKIATAIEHGKNRYGENTSWANYRLEINDGKLFYSAEQH